MTPKVSYESSSFQQLYYIININLCFMMSMICGMVYANQSLALSNVEPEEDDIAVLHNILLSFLNVLSLCLHRLLVTQRHQIFVFHDLSTNEPLLEVSVDHSRSLRRLCQFSHCPASHLIGSRSEIVDKVQCVIASLDDLGNHRPFFLILVLKLLSFVLGTVRDDLSGNVLINPFLDFLEPLVLLADEVILAEVHQIDNRLSSDQPMSVQDTDLGITPVTVTHPLVLLKQVQYLHQNLLLLTGVLRIGPFNHLLHVLQSISDVFEILED